jgi:hypothetical protein
MAPGTHRVRDSKTVTEGSLCSAITLLYCVFM